MRDLDDLRYPLIAFTRRQEDRVTHDRHLSAGRFANLPPQLIDLTLRLCGFLLPRTEYMNALLLHSQPDRQSDQDCHPHEIAPRELHAGLKIAYWGMFT